jgi:phenylacetate-CoA ligase
VLGRVDGMVIVRGVNVFPGAIENIMRGFPELDQFELEVDRRRDLPQLVVRIEVTDDSEVAAALAEAIRRRLTLWSRVEAVPAGSLPRYELRARRFKPS